MTDVTDWRAEAERLRVLLEHEQQERQAALDRLADAVFARTASQAQAERYMAERNAARLEAQRDVGEAMRKLQAELAQAREVLTDCAETLEGYARHHAERGPEHAHKVARNAELAARCRAALVAKGE